MKLLLQLPGIFFSEMFWITIALISFGVIFLVIIFNALKTPTDYNALFEGREEGGRIVEMFGDPGEGIEDEESMKEPDKRQHYAGGGFL